MNADYDIYELRTRVTEHGATLEAGPLQLIGRRDRQTRRAALGATGERHLLRPLTDFENPEFEEARAISHAFNGGLHELFFDAHDHLRKLTQLYGVF